MQSNGEILRLIFIVTIDVLRVAGLNECMSLFWGINNLHELHPNSEGFLQNDTCSFPYKLKSKHNYTPFITLLQNCTISFFARMPTKLKH